MPQVSATSLASLLRATSIEDHEEILKAANAALKSDKNDQLAQHTRVVAFLKLDRFDDASRAITESGVKLESTCALEKAYSLYKLGKLNEAATALSSTGLHNRGLSHIAAQVAYRAGNFDEAQSIYNRLLGADSHGEDHDLRINIEASQAQDEWKRNATPHKIELQKIPESFELCYNSACVKIAQGSLNIALKLLQRALALCDASDELTQKEKEEERKPILVQQAFVLAMLGELNRARDIHKVLKYDAISDSDLSIICQNNFQALGNLPHNSFLLERQFATWIKSSSEAKLFDFQSNILVQNYLIVSLWAHKIHGVKTRAHKTVCQARQPSYSSEINNMSVIAATAETLGLTEKDMLQRLISLSKGRPFDTAIVLIIVQLFMRRRNAGAALHTLESFFSRLEKSNNDQCQKVRFSPALISLAVALKKTQRRDNSAKSELIKAAKFWYQRPASLAFSLLREAGVELVSSFKKDDLVMAGAIFKKLNEEKLISSVTSAGVVAALAASSVSEVGQHMGQLPTIDSLVSGICVEKLVDSGVLAGPRTSISKKRLSPTDNAGERAMKRRRRKLPKNFVEGQAPDPERWLPLRDRASYRPKGRKGRKKMESTQGGVVKEEETIGLVGGGGVRVEKASSSNASKKKKSKK